jgi:sec-independent protein translocase protein TatA
MFANLTGWHFLIVVLVILLLFGATRLPALAKSIGQSTKIFRKEMAEATAPEEAPEATPVAESLPTRAVTPER